MKISVEDRTRFWAKVLIKGVNECWEWQAGRSKLGYGIFSIKHKWIGAHVVSFILHNGYKPDSSKNRLVMHDCENPSCVNPKHLLEGNPKKNGNYPGCVSKLKARVGPLAPMYGRRGQNSPRFGMKHSAAAKEKQRKAALKRGGWHKGLKRSQETKARISAATRGEKHACAKLTNQLVKEIFYSTDKKSLLARQLGIDASIISRIKARKAWKHITEGL